VKGSWPIPELFLEIQQRSKLTDGDMFETLNMGIGLVMVVAPKEWRTWKNNWVACIIWEPWNAVPKESVLSESDPLPPSDRFRVAILVSGSGTNMET